MDNHVEDDGVRHVYIHVDSALVSTTNTSRILYAWKRRES